MTQAICFHKTQGFVPFNNEVFSPESLIPTIWVAKEDVNSDCTILPDYLLQIDIVNTKVIY